MQPYSIIGIDFGTSSTVVKVKNYYDGMQESDALSLIVNGSAVIPTLVFEKHDQSRFFGFEAKRLYDAQTEGTFYQSFKMDLISSNSDIKEKAKSLVSDFMKYLYVEYEQQKDFLHVNPTCKTYISYPAKWNGTDLPRFMKQCVIDAGFGDVNTVFGEDEPTAAIYTTFVHCQESFKENHIIVQNIPINVMMIDMGAGTTDVTIFKMKVDGNNNFEIGVDNQRITYPAINNQYLCGGREIDEILSNYLADQYVHKYIRTEYQNMEHVIIESIKRSIKTWKEINVSPALKDETEIVYLPANIQQFAKMGFFGQEFEGIDRAKYELIILTHRENLHRLISDAITEATKKIEGLHGAEDIDLVILTGGHSQWYLMEDYILGKPISGSILTPLNFKKIIENPQRLIHESRPQETVANGLVYHDLSFDVAHTAPNNIRLRISLNYRNSEIYDIVSIGDALPIDKTLPPFHIVLTKNSGTTDDIRMKCNLYSGGIDMENSIPTSYTKSFKTQDLLLSIIGKLFGGFLGATEDYTITAKPKVHINNDGTGHIEIHAFTNRNEEGGTIRIEI